MHFALDSFLTMLDSALLFLSGSPRAAAHQCLTLVPVLPLSSIKCKVTCQLSVSGWGLARVLSIPREFGLFSRTLDVVVSETRDETRRDCRALDFDLYQIVSFIV